MKIGSPPVISEFNANRKLIHDTQYEKAYGSSLDIGSSPLLLFSSFDDPL